MITADIIRKNPLRMMNGRKLCGSAGSNRRCISNDERGAGAVKRIIKVYECSDLEWVSACSPKSALRFYLSETGVDFKYDMDSKMPVEVCDSEMERLKFIDEGESEENAKSFKAQLEAMVKAKKKFPCWFACADY